MDGLSRLAQLFVRKPELVKRNVEINAPHRNLNYKECRKCVAVSEKGKRFVLWLTLFQLRSERVVNHSRQDACRVY